MSGPVEVSSSPLSRSLVDAAAVAIVTSIGYEARHAVDFEDEGRAAVAAVLETLAAAYVRLEATVPGRRDPGGVTWRELVVVDLRGLAAEVKSEEDKT